MSTEALDLPPSKSQNPPEPPIPPAPPDKQFSLSKLTKDDEPRHGTRTHEKKDLKNLNTPLTTSGTDKDLSLKTSTIPSNVKNLRVVHIEDIPFECNYEDIASSLKAFGIINEIRMNYLETKNKWEAWVMFEKYRDAFEASCNLQTIKISKYFNFIYLIIK